MARPVKQGIDYFPKWSPQRGTASHFGSSEKRVKYRSLRNSSSAFIKREDVRNAVFTKDGNACVSCGSISNLQVDHIVSVYRCAKNEIEITFLNRQENLQTLCRSCNSKKLP